MGDDHTIPGGGTVKKFIPAKLQHLSPTLYKLACQAKTQEQAGRYIRIAIPDFDISDKTPWYAKVTKDAIQAAGDYSLDACQGGSRYHEPSKDNRGSTYASHKVKASFEVPEPPERRTRRYPKGTRRLSGKDGGMLLPKPQ